MVSRSTAQGPCIFARQVPRHIHDDWRRGKLNHGQGRAARQPLGVNQSRTLGDILAHNQIQFPTTSTFGSETDNLVRNFRESRRPSCPETPRAGSGPNPGPFAMTGGNIIGGNFQRASHLFP